MFFFEVDIFMDMFFRDFLNNFIGLEFDVLDFFLNFFMPRWLFMDGFNGVKFPEDGFVERNKTLRFGFGDI